MARLNGDPHCRGGRDGQNRPRRAIASDESPIILSETAAVCLIVRRGWLIRVVA